MMKNFRSFYEAYPQICQTVSGELPEQLSSSNKLENIGDQFRLGWSHYQVLTSLKNSDERSSDILLYIDNYRCCGTLLPT